MCEKSRPRGVATASSVHGFASRPVFFSRDATASTHGKGFSKVKSGVFVFVFVFVFDFVFVFAASPEERTSNTLLSASMVSFRPSFGHCLASTPSSARTLASVAASPKVRARRATFSSARARSSPSPSRASETPTKYRGTSHAGVSSVSGSSGRAGRAATGEVFSALSETSSLPRLAGSCATRRAPDSGASSRCAMRSMDDRSDSASLRSSRREVSAAASAGSARRDTAVAMSGPKRAWSASTKHTAKVTTEARNRATLRPVCARSALVSGSDRRCSSSVATPSVELIVPARPRDEPMRARNTTSVFSSR
mmetsp:Transcript_3179/g.12768  ORF Transcript_3179/g.12768 Transcript_3179/m.12768 type:complete len:310 (-) Transcript_3179:137-1066(-)